MATARFTGVGTRRGGIPAAGVLDVDCLGSSSLPGFVCAAGAGTPEHIEMLAAVLAAVRRAYGRRVRALLFRQLGVELLPAVLHWPAVVREGDPIAVFRNEFTDFEGYLATLGQRRRSSLRRHLRRLDNDPELVIAFTGRGDTVTPSLPVADLCALSDRIVTRHHRRWWLRRRLLAPEVARAQLAQPGLHWLTYHDRAGVLLAYGTVWDHPTEPVAAAWGARDLADGGRKHLWFHNNATLVRWCVESGRPGFLSGRGSLDLKLDLGYQLRRQWTVLVPVWHGRP